MLLFLNFPRKLCNERKSWWSGFRLDLAMNLRATVTYRFNKILLTSQGSILE